MHQITITRGRKFKKEEVDVFLYWTRMPRDRWQQKKLQSGQERVSSEQVGDGSREVETSKTFNFFFNLKKSFFFNFFQ